jgi:hypothetical protein
MAHNTRLAIRSWQASAAPTGVPDAVDGRRRYDRARDLPRLLALWPHEIDDCSPTGRAHLISVLQRALRRERQRGLDGHWAYDLARHRALLAAALAEHAEPRRHRPKPDTVKPGSGTLWAASQPESGANSDLVSRIGRKTEPAE